MESNADEAKGWVAFEISSELRQRAEAVVRDLRTGSNNREFVPELVKVVLAMTDRGLYYYFLHPLEEAGVGTVTRGAVKLALGAAGRTLPTVIRKTVKSLDDEQLLKIADFIDHILITDEAEESSDQS